MSTTTIAFYHNLHVQYIQSLASKIDSPTSYEGAVTEHLRMSGIYWSITALSLLLPAEQVDQTMHLTSCHSSSESSSSSIVDFVYECFDEKSGGFGGNKMHDGHILYTLSAIQILAMADALQHDRFLQIKPFVIRFIGSLQLSDGSFMGDKWGEIDTRFSYCALSSLSLLGVLNDPTGTIVDVNKAAEFISSCQNFDGGFGCYPGAESHAGQIFTCVGALSIAKRLDLLKDVDLLCWWLSERQCDSGGLNGRPEKQADVCYSWWILSSLSILGRVDWISREKLATFIFKCQDEDDGGIADRPGDMVDAFHTFFGIAGLSLLGILHCPLEKGEEGVGGEEGDIVTILESDGGEEQKRQYRRIDPVYALPTDVVQKLKLQGQIMMPNKDSSLADDRLQSYHVYYSNIATDSDE